MQIEAEQPAEVTRVDTLIIGAGPAGLQLGYYLSRSSRSYLILEEGYGPGMFFRTFPRHRTLISINKVYTGYEDPEINQRWDWNSLLCDDPDLVFKAYSQEYFPSADDLVRYLGDFASRWQIAVRYRTRVERVSRDDQGFLVRAADGSWFRGDRLVVATGLSRPFHPEIPGLEHAEPYTTVSTDPQEFKNQRVLILGKGNSAFETADCLTSTAALIHVASPRPVKFAWKTHFVGHLRAVNNNFLDTYQLKSQNAILDGDVRSIERRPEGLAVSIHYSHAEEETETLFYDRVILCTGFRFDASIFDSSCAPALCIDDRFPDQTSAWESVNVPGMYFAGTLMQMRDFKKSTSGFIHGFRYNVRALARLIDSRAYGSPWPSKVVDGRPEGLARAILERVNQTPALWQLFGFLGEVFVLQGDERRATYYPELPLAHIRESIVDPSDEHVVLSLEFGPCPEDPFNIPRKPSPEAADQSTFLHPVVRHYQEGKQVGELHLLENLLGEWKSEELHVKPLVEFLVRCRERSVLARA
ncbi:MAG TPA: NAD(P)-binding domain-containing protein [Thermoanaerobaculia bacterium]|nr:NAD(P)-binding domain-containing protein [Thermoanaerobaculia bacterium]